MRLAQSKSKRLYGKLLYSIAKKCMHYKFGQVCFTNGGSLVLLEIKETLLQIGTALLLQIGTGVVTNRGSYYKLEQPFLKNRAAVASWEKVYYKLGQLLQFWA